MRSVVSRMLAGVCLWTTLAFSGPHAGGGALYERLICVVPMVGAGTLEDPRRPLFAPVAGQPSAAGKRSKGFAEPPAIVEYHSVLADDGETAIVEFVARDRAAFRQLRASGSQALAILDPHKLTPEDILQTLRQYKRDFEFSMLAEGGL